MDVLVTGATGFIGSNLARRLVELGYPVRILMRKKSSHRAISDFESRVKIVYGDITDKASLDEATKGVSQIYHCAGKATSVRESASNSTTSTSQGRAICSMPQGKTASRASSTQVPFPLSELQEQNSLPTNRKSGI